jgi:hypothetical protein
METQRPRYKDIREALYRLKSIQFALNNEYEENGGEETESTISKEEMKDTILYMLENGGVDQLARLLNSVKADIDQYKEEQKFLKRQQEKQENFQEDVLECINMAMEALGEEKMKGDFGYSFTQHVASSTKPDNKLIKEMFFKDVERAIREAKVCPDHITFTLSASSNLLKKGEDMPDYFTTTSRARATYRKPLKKEDTAKEEFTQNDFENFN